MNAKDVKTIAKTGVNLIATLGVFKILRNITPYEGPFGTIACATATFFIGLAMQDVIDDQMMKCERILQGLANGDQMVVF